MLGSDEATNRPIDSSLRFDTYEADSEAADDAGGHGMGLENFDEVIGLDFGSAQEDEQILINAVIEHAGQASQQESQAMDYDRAGQAREAIVAYRAAAEKLAKAAQICPEALPDKAILSRHAGEVLGRVVYLESLGGSPATAPLEQHIGSVQLTMGMAAPSPSMLTEDAEAEELGFATLSSDQDMSSGVLVMTDDQVGTEELTSVSRATSSQAPPASLRKQAASAAAIAGGTGLLVLHAPLAAVAMAGAAAYATTRKDKAGKVARKVGDVGLHAASRTKEFAEEHRISARVNGSLGKVINSETAAGTMQSLRSFNEKHQVTRTIGGGAFKAASGVASATSSLSGWVANRIRR
mmetsp:Transcript_78421/g.139063  ORF Transcript_78421/g.139063 Transcript_78421/m.139063 type:complete len:352 (+) Transcript_78421:88-1143(+)